MQKLLSVEGKNGTDIEKVNILLDDGWEVIEMQCSCPNGDHNLEGLLLLEKKLTK